MKDTYVYGIEILCLFILPNLLKIDIFIKHESVYEYKDGVYESWGYDLLKIRMIFK